MLDRHDDIEDEECDFNIIATAVIDGYNISIREDGSYGIEVVDCVTYNQCHLKVARFLAIPGSGSSIKQSLLRALDARSD